MAYNSPDNVFTDPPSATWGRQINDNFIFLQEGRASMRVNYSLQNVADDTPTELIQSSPTGSVGALYTGVTYGVQGLYLITVNIGSTASVGGSDRRYVRLCKNDTDYLATRQGSRSLNGTFYSAFSVVTELVEDDLLSVVVYQNAGVTMSFYGSLSLTQLCPLASP